MQRPFFPLSVHRAVRGLSAAALSLSLLWAPATAGAADPPQRGKVVGAQVFTAPDWFKMSFLEIAEDVEEASAEDKHVLLFFHLEGCPYCYRMVEENFKNSPYTAFLQQHFDVIAINVRGDREVVFTEEVNLTEKDLARYLRVRFTPTVIFLGDDNEPVLRLNGYRSLEGFKHALDFVAEKAYRHTGLSNYIEQRVDGEVYRFRDHPAFVDTDDLSTGALPDKPLMVLFEDRTCDECAALHDDILSLEKTREILDDFTVVRLDALSDAPLTGPDGTPTSPRRFAESLAIDYRPGVVLFDRGREILRIDGQQYRYHFQQLLRYVGERQYQEYPQMRDFMRAQEQQILDSGEDIDIGR